MGSNQVKLTSAILLISLSGGCSATRKISEVSNSIRAEAVAIRENARQVLPFLSSSPEGVKLEQDTIRRTDNIEKGVASVQEELTATQDKEGSWLKALKMVSIIVGSVAVIGALWVFRRPLMAGGAVVSAMLDPLAKSRARMDVEALEASPDNQPLREAIAAYRGSDPKYDALFRKAKREKEKESAMAENSWKGQVGDKVDEKLKPIYDKTGFTTAGTVKRRWMVFVAGLAAGLFAGFILGAVLV